MEGVGSQETLNNFVVILIIISFLVASDFYRLEFFKAVGVGVGVGLGLGVGRHSPVPFLTLHCNRNWL